MRNKDLIRPELFTDLYRLLRQEWPEIANEAVIMLGWSEEHQGIEVTISIGGRAVDILLPDRLIPVRCTPIQLCQMIAQHAECKSFFLHASERPLKQAEARGLTFATKYRRTHAHA